MIKNNITAKIFCLVSLIVSSTTFAKQYEASASFGKSYGSNLVSAINSDTDLSSGGANNFSIGLAWQESPNGQGQILISSVSHSFNSDLTNQKHDLDILYAHFNGIAQFKQPNYITTVAIGLGGAQFDSVGGSELYPSATLAIGTRYEFSPQISLITELRGYGSLVDKKDNIFCRADVCTAQFDNSLYFDTSISVGFAIKF